MKRTGLLATALLLSLAANAFLVGWLIARPATPALAFGLQSQPMRQLMARVEALPDAQRSEVSAIISTHAPELRRRDQTRRRSDAHLCARLREHRRIDRAHMLRLEVERLVKSDPLDARDAATGLPGT